MPEVSAEFVWRMEEVLEFYGEAPDPHCPRLCFDETSKQMVKEVRPPTPMAPGQPERFDGEYQRNGVVNLFLAYNMDTGQRHVSVTQQRTKRDFAEEIKALLTGPYASAWKLRILLDNLNTHTPASFYEAFPAEEARALVERVEFIYTPRHGSWLNQAEMEFAALKTQCLDRRLGDGETVKREVAVWQQRRNAAKTRIKWCFRVEDARTKLKRLYPSHP
jgi:hypothetical protein